MAQGYTGTSGFKIQGQVAQGGADAGNPVKVGIYAITALPTAVANGQDANVIGDKFGRPILLLNSIRDLTVQNTTTLTNTTETTILSAGAAGVFNDITALHITNTSATAVRVDLRDATGGSVVDSYGIAANGGAIIPLLVPMKQTTAANNWTAQLSGAVTDIRIWVQAVQNK